MISRSRGCWWSKGLLLGAVSVAAAGCDDDPGPPDPWECSESRALTAKAAPLGTQAGEPYRWLARSWRSPLGLTFRTYGLAVDGIAVHARHQVEVYDGRGKLVHRAGSGDAVLAALRGARDPRDPRDPTATGATAKAAPAPTPRRYHHPLAAQAITRRAQPHPRMRDVERPVWFYDGGELRPAIAAERLNLVGREPIGEVALRDAVTGAELARHRTIFDVVDPDYLVYAREDGRPLYSPLGDIFPHPTGVPDNQVPALVSQRSMRQSQVVRARAEPWIDPADSQTYGPNVFAFFNSMIDGDGNLADTIDADGKDTPEYGPFPDDLGNDFFATASGDRFAFSYDPNASVGEYFQDGELGEPFPEPNQQSVALNAKIVQGFYATNWLHDFFYAAGFDEVAGNAQQTNHGRGGTACDPLIVHSGFYGTYTVLTADGTSPVLELGLHLRSRSRRDASMDFSITAHEWGHYLIGRLGGMTAESDSMGNLQGRSLHEGLADFVAVLVNLDAGDDLNGAFPVGAYFNLDYIETRPTLPPEEAPADLFYGIRRFPYSLDLAKNPLTFRHLAEPPPLPFYNWKRRGPNLAEVHTGGEIFSQALFQCFGNIVAANAATPFEELRTRMAKYLVASLVAFPDHPTFLDARDSFLAIIRLTSPADHLACRAGFATRGMGAGALGPDRDFAVDDPLDGRYVAADIRESFVDAD